MDIKTWASLVEKATGQEREGARAFLYATKFGVPEAEDECIEFKEPTCENWDCLNPEHQILAFS